jgi:hypothetical protein
VLFLGISILLFFFSTISPVKYIPFQATLLVRHHVMFYFLFLLWLVLNGYLLMNTKSVYVAPVVAIVFLIVIWGFWTFAAPLGSEWDTPGNSALVNSIVNKGHLPSPDTFPYAQLPGMHIFSAFLSEIFSIAPVLLVQTQLLLWQLIIGFLTYILFSKLTGSPLHAAMSVELLALSNPYMAQIVLIFAPYFFALVFVPIVLFILRPQSNSSLMLLVILTSAATITHFVTSIVLLVILFIAAFLARRAKQLYLLLCAAFVFLAWNLWEAFIASRSILYILEAEVSLQFKYIEQITIGPITTLPLWVSVIKWFWIVLIYLSPFALSIWSKLRRTHVTTSPNVPMKYYTILLLFFIALAFVNAQEQIYLDRFLLYASFLAPPIFLLFTSKRRTFVRVVMLIIILLGLPSFFAYHATLAQIRVTAPPYESSNYLSMHTDPGLSVITTNDISGILVYYNPNLNLLPGSTYSSPSQFSSQINSSLRTLSLNQNALFIYSHNVPEVLAPSIPTNSLLWRSLQADISRMDLVYDSPSISFLLSG